MRIRTMAQPALALAGIALLVILAAQASGVVGVHFQDEAVRTAVR